MSESKLELKKERLGHKEAKMVTEINEGQLHNFTIPIVEVSIPGQYIVEYSYTVYRVLDEGNGDLEQQLRLMQIMKK